MRASFFISNNAGLGFVLGNGINLVIVLLPIIY